MEWKRMLSAALAGLILVPALTLPALAAQETGAAGETFADKALHAIELAGRYGGADSVRYALWEDGAITAQGGWGVYSKTENRALTEDILYGIGSVSKTYTAAAVLTLAQDGKLKLEDPVTEYLPGFTMADERYEDITVRMLLDHSSGLMGDTTRDAFLFGDTDESAADDLLERLSTQRLKAAPGAYCVYSNDGYTLAQLVVEAVSGMDFMDYLHAAILDPAGLTDTYAPGDDFDTGRLARTYASAEDTRALPQDTVGIVGTGGLYATAADLASFGGLLCGNDLLSQEWLDLMNTDWAVKGLWPEDSENDTLAYGLGWDNVHQYPFNQSGITALVKGGDTLRYHASLIVLPEEDKAVAVLSSGGVSTYDQLAGERILIDALAEEGMTVDESLPALPEAKPAVIPGALKTNAGTYVSLGMVATVAFPDDKTMTLTNAAALGGAVQTFTYRDDGTFLDETGSFLLKFVTGDNGRTYLYQEGYAAVPGLTASGTANYALEKLEPNTEASQAALDAWAARSSELYLIVNEKYTSQVYLSGPFTATTVLPETTGYAAGFQRIVDETLARQYIQLPGTGSRNGADYQMVTVDGKECLKAGDYLCAPASGLGNLYAGAGAYCTILEEGYARWFNVGDLAGKTLSVTLPEAGGFTVYDASGVVTASSVAYGDSSAVLPEGGWIVFAGEPGARFYLSLAE